VGRLDLSGASGDPRPMDASMCSAVTTNPEPHDSARRWSKSLGHNAMVFLPRTAQFASCPTRREPQIQGLPGRDGPPHYVYS
jgi:hypothetical protein